MMQGKEREVALEEKAKQQGIKIDEGLLAIGRITVELQQARNEVVSLERCKQEQESLVELVQAESNSLHLQMSKQAGELTKAHQQIDELSTQLSTLQQEVLDLESTNGQLTQRLEASQKEVFEAGRKAELARAALEVSQATQSQTKDKLVELQEEVAKLEALKVEANKLCCEAQESMSRQGKLVASLEGKVVFAENELQQTRTQVERVLMGNEDQLAAHKRVEEGLLHRIDGKAVALASLTREYSELDTKNKQMAQELARKEQLVEELCAKVISLESQLGAHPISSGAQCNEFSSLVLG